MTTYEEQKHKVSSLIKYIIKLANSLKRTEIANALEEAQKHLDKEQLSIIACGEFKQGKSTFLNAILNETDIFPVDIDIATNVVSTISYSEEEKITVIRGEIGKGEAKQISRAEIPNYVTEQGNQENFQKTQMVTIESPNPQLKKGLIFIDTPGVSSLSTEHTALTYTFIPNADAVLFISDAFAPLSQKELDFITEKIYPHCKNIIFVLTKIDAVNNYEKIIESNREKLVQRLYIPSDKIRIVPVSSKNKLDYLNSHDEEDLQDSNFEALEGEIWQLITQQRGKILLAKAVAEIAKALSNLQMPLKAELSTHSEKNKQKTQPQTEKLKAQFTETQQRYQNLLENNADWVQKLGYGLEDIRDRVNDQFQNTFIDINSKTDAYLKDDRLLETPKEIATLLEEDLDMLMLTLHVQLNQMAAKLHGEIEHNTAINLNPFEVEPLDYHKAQLDRETVEVKKAGVSDKALAIGRGLAYGGAPGTTIGGVIGAVVGFAVTLPLGGVGVPVGFATGGTLLGIAAMVKTTKQNLSQLNQKDKAVLKAEVAPIIKHFLSESRLSCNEALKNSVKELGRFMKDELRKQIKQEKKKCEEVLKSIKAAESLPSDKVDERIQGLKKILKRINELRQEADELAKSTLQESNS
ncbi:dynamin family protein [Calothrix sp. CCY 0018]|uniref:dynamin family protein n=1 Tax=Calothrix sp. CCY 0018 TaxID=3103864 RepID=UPI0039C6406D